MINWTSSNLELLLVEIFSYKNEQPHTGEDIDAFEQNIQPRI